MISSPVFLFYCLLACVSVLLPHFSKPNGRKLEELGQGDTSGKASANQEVKPRGWPARGRGLRLSLHQTNEETEFKKRQHEMKELHDRRQEDKLKGLIERQKLLEKYMLSSNVKVKGSV